MCGEMNKVLKRVIIAVLCTAFFLLPLTAQAKATVLKDTSLKTVTKAKSVEGKLVKEGKKYRFRLADGKYQKNGWFKAEDHIYYADAKGYLVKGWVQYRKQLYYLGWRCALQTGWLEKGKKLYYLKKNGQAARGLYTVEDDSYYFNRTTGAATSGWVQISGQTYYFNPNTFRMARNKWIKIDRKYFYVDKNGRKCGQGWRKIKGEKYYLDSDGARVTGTQYIGSKGYYFTKQGVYDPSVKVKPEVDPKKPMVALTFDDGPGIYTDRLLECLKKNNAKATFFMVGSSVPNYKATIKKMVSMGCELGAHSYSHTAFTRLSNSAIASEVSRTVNNIKAAAGQGPTLFRLPYGDGASNSRVLSSLGLPSIYWSIDTRDWANTGNPSHTVNEVLNHVKSGDIVLMHDIHRSTIVAAEQIIPALKKRGYQLVTVSQLAKYKGKTTLQAGKTYYSFK